MSEKEKGKGHPFAGHLGDDEEILWMSSPVPRLRDRLLYWLSPFFAVIIFLVGGKLTGVIEGDYINVDVNVIGIYVMGFFFTGLLIAAIVIGVPTTIIYFLWQKRQPICQFYAVTDKRLLHRYKSYIYTLNLEDIPTNLNPDDMTSRRLIFENPSWIWDDLVDGLSVYEMIQQVQKDRFKAIPTCEYRITVNP